MLNKNYEVKILTSARYPNLVGKTGVISSFKMGGKKVVVEIDDRKLTFDIENVQKTGRHFSE